jgi:hypothetical protein
MEMEPDHEMDDELKKIAINLLFGIHDDERL